MNTEIPHWRIRPSGHLWQMETPTGAVVNCSSSMTAIEIATRQAQKVLVYDASGKVKTAEDFSDAL